LIWIGRRLDVKEIGCRPVQPLSHCLVQG
jgi:hypothetical protein